MPRAMARLTPDQWDPRSLPAAYATPWTKRHRCDGTHTLPAKLTSMPKPNRCRGLHDVEVFCLIRRYLSTASSILDVGSAQPPFLSQFGFVPNRTILAPFFRDYSQSMSKSANRKNRYNYNSNHERSYVAPPGIATIKADFATWQPPANLAETRYDVAISMQTLEHVTQPAAFLRKLRQISKHTIITLPYRWNDTAETHVWHNVDEHQVAGWNEQGSPPVANLVLTSGLKRLVQMYVN